MEWFSQFLKVLTQTLIGFGVPEEMGQLAALGLLYIVLTLLLLLLILQIVRRVRTRNAEVKTESASGADEAEASPEEAIAPESPEQESPVSAKDEPLQPSGQPADSPPEETTPGLTAAGARPAVPLEEVPPVSMLDRLRQGLNKTRSSLVNRVDALLSSHAKLDDAFIEEFEEILITADFGMETTQDLVRSLTEKAASTPIAGAEGLRELLAEEIRQRLNSKGQEVVVPETPPLVIMVVGVNGVGKTTTIGKLARQFANEGKRVVLGAGDTFRAAAVQQLEVWGERAGADVIKHAEGSDPSAVAFDAARAAVARKADVLILDTAGRLHTKQNLMEELTKMRRVLGREIPGAPHETLLVLDATTGQNALLQARKFLEAVEVSGVALTKLDGTAKGGIVVAISSHLQLPVRYIGIGEGVDDLRPFDPGEFVDALFR